MGWQDAPVEETGKKPAWESAPVVGEDKPRVNKLSPEPTSIYQNSGIVGAYETGRALLQGAAGSALGGLAGIAQGAKNLVSPGMDAADRVRQVEGALSYQPESDAAKQALAVASYIPEKIAQGADIAGAKVADVTGSPALGAATNTALQSAPQLVARGLKSPISKMYADSEAKAAGMKSRNSVGDATLAEARKEGYVAPPSSDGTGGSFVGNRIESVAGKAALNQEASIRNQQVTNKIARRESGLSENSPITEETLKAARETIAQPYREVAAISPMAENALEGMKDARARAKLKWREYERQQTTASLDEAKALDAKASMYETAIEKIAAKSGQPDLVNRVREARVSLAKNYDVERALNVGNGNVEASVIGSMLDHRGINAMSGGLRTVGQFEQAHGRYAREAGKVPAPGVSKSELAASVIFGLGGFAGAGLPGIAAAAVPFLHSPARALALSKLMQSPRTYAPSTTASLAELATRNPDLYAASPTLANKNR